MDEEQDIYSECCGTELGYDCDNNCWCCSKCGTPAGLDMNDEDEDDYPEWDNVEATYPPFW
jgi:hypothetical protein